MCSSTEQMKDNPNFTALIAMSDDVLPTLLDDLKVDPCVQDFLLLHVITGATPVKPEHRGVVRLMADDWIGWFRDNEIE
jgi:hypothetical protein